MTRPARGDEHRHRTVLKRGNLGRLVNARTGGSRRPGDAEREIQRMQMACPGVVNSPVVDVGTERVREWLLVDPFDRLVAIVAPELFDVPFFAFDEALLVRRGVQAVAQVAVDVVAGDQVAYERLRFLGERP